MATATNLHYLSSGTGEFSCIDDGVASLCCDDSSLEGTCGVVSGEDDEASISAARSAVGQGPSNPPPTPLSSIRRMLAEAQIGASRMTRWDIATRLKIRRSALREVTVLRSWPLQELALKDLDQLEGAELEAMEIEDDTSRGLGSGRNPFGLPTLSTSTDGRGGGSRLGEGEGLCRAHRRSSIGGRDIGVSQALDPRVYHSPGKVALWHQYVTEFRAQESLSSLPALWSMEPRIFSMEVSSTGKRRYIVGQLGRFMDWYWRKTDPNQRHCYELIREGTPCRLYLDLEFARAANPEINGDVAEQLMAELVEELRQGLLREYGIQVDRTAFIGLDSSTEKKFSRHLIVHLPDHALFADACEVGVFVRRVVGTLAEEIAIGALESRRPALARHLYVRTKEGKGTVAAENDTCFVDLSVYTRNRLFRLLGSAKYGKPSSAALRIASANAFPFPHGFANDRFYVPDQAHAVDLGTSGSIVATSSCTDHEMARFSSALDWTAHAVTLAATLVVPPSHSEKVPLILPRIDRDCKALRASLARRAPETLGGHRPTTAAGRPDRRTQCGPSPFPVLDQYVAKVLGSRNGAVGWIRAWDCDRSLSSSAIPRCITYHMKGNRHCERIGRPHRSNNVMWTVDFGSMRCYQTCYDPDCRAAGFRGEPICLPLDVQEGVRERLFEYELAALDEGELLGRHKSQVVEGCTGRPRSTGGFPSAHVAGALGSAKGPSESILETDDGFELVLNQAIQMSPEQFP